MSHQSGVGCFYTGVGSRRAPSDALDLMTALARKFAEFGWTLRSGHAMGSDYAFELGCGGEGEIYLPFASYNDFLPLYGRPHSEPPSQAAIRTVYQFHPAPTRLRHNSVFLHARNAYQVLGDDVDHPDPSSFLVCWTPDGADGVEDPTSRLTGGTGQAIRIAVEYGVPVLNLQRPEIREQAERWLRCEAA